MKESKAIDIMLQIKAEYFYAFKDMPDNLFKKKVLKFQETLKDYTDKELDLALNIVFKESKTVPGIAHFYEILERNREMLLPTAEEEWDRTLKIIHQVASNAVNFSPSCCDWKEYNAKQQSLYNQLSDDVKAFYVSYEGFREVAKAEKLEVKQAQFLKGFAEFRRNKRKRKEIETLEETGGEANEK